MGKMKQKISGKWDFIDQKYNWESEKLKPEYHQIMKVCGIWEENRDWGKIMGKGNRNLVEILFLREREKENHPFLVMAK